MDSWFRSSVAALWKLEKVNPASGLTHFERLCVRFVLKSQCATRPVDSLRIGLICTIGIWGLFLLNIFFYQY